MHKIKIFVFRQKHVVNRKVSLFEKYLYETKKI